MHSFFSVYAKLICFSALTAVAQDLSGNPLIFCRTGVAQQILPSW